MWRFVRLNDGTIAYDRERTAFGRGANVCAQKQCFEMAIERKAFARAFKQAVLVDKMVLQSTVF